MRNEWDMSFVISAHEVLSLMAQALYDVVVAGMRMPVMDEAQLLDEVKERYPKSVSIILSDQSDREMNMRLLGATHQYLSKPCSAENLTVILNRVFAIDGLILKNLASCPTCHGLTCSPVFPPWISEFRMNSRPQTRVWVASSTSLPMILQ